jgi:hypothetical protein
MLDRPPLLEEPFAQTLSEKKQNGKKQNKTIPDPNGNMGGVWIN